MLVRVKTFPQSSQEKVVKKTEDKFDIYVKAKPKEGEANERALKLLAGELGTDIKNLKIIKGAKGRNKIVKLLTP